MIFEITIIAILSGLSTTLVGIFLVTRKMSMISDSITHTVLLGIVISFFIVNDFNSPFLIIGAAGVGILTVFLTEQLQKSRLVSEDSSIGLVFPLLFSIAIILITKYADYIHLDTDSVLLGELAFVPFDRLVAFGFDIGPKGLYTSLLMFIINLLFVVIFNKELKLATFDSDYAAIIGFSPTLIHYMLMSLTSLTTVVAFDVMGSILVVACMIGPAATAFLMSKKMSNLIVIALLISTIDVIIGIFFAFLLDVSIAGSIACAIGFVFIITLIFSPYQGVIGKNIKKRRYNRGISKQILLVHLLNHMGTEEEEYECGCATIKEHLLWKEKQLDSLIAQLKIEEAIYSEDGILYLTRKGYKRALITESFFD